jgi:hypothetical protein
MAAVELKEKGNQEYQAQRYDVALRYYTEAIELDPKNVDLLNNRAATYHALGRFDEAIADADRSIKVSSSSKGYSRKAAALWAKGELEKARDAYELALVLAPRNELIRENLSKVRAEIANKVRDTQIPGPGRGRGGGGAGGSHLAVVLDVAVVCLAVLHVLTMLFAAGMSFALWRLTMAAMAARQLLILQSSGLLQPKLAVLKQWPSHFSAQYFVITAAVFLFGVQPVHLLLAACVIYCIIDFLPHYPLFDPHLPAYLRERASAVVRRAQGSRDHLLGNAAICEAMMTFMLLFSGTPLFFNIIYLQFIKFRYRADPYCRLAFGALRQMVERLTKHPKCPAAVDNMFAKMCDLLSRFVQ